jgi:predicted HAD superfamily phosphohydrolase YqeG
MDAGFEKDIQMKRIHADFILEHYTQITPEWMKTFHFRTLLIPVIGDKAETFTAWYRELEQAGYAVIIVSNKTQKSVDAMRLPTHMIGYGSCKKPMIRKITAKLFAKGLDPETTCFLGHRLLIDIWCGIRLGVKTAYIKQK